MFTRAVERVLDRARVLKRTPCLVLFDGMGWSRLALQLEGFECLGVELDADKCRLSDVLVNRHFGFASECVCADVTAIDISDELLNQFAAVWCSPPCQVHSAANPARHAARPHLAQDLIQWSLGRTPGSLLQRYTGPVLWVENVHNKYRPQAWGVIFNQAQFEEVPSQNRNRVIGGRYPPPATLRPQSEWYYAVPGRRFVETDTGIRVDHVPARSDAAATPTDAPGFERALLAMPADVARRLRAELEPIRGIAPVLLASEFKAPGSIRDVVPRVHTACRAAVCRASVAQIAQGHTEWCEAIACVLAREHHFARDSRMCSRYYRRRITLREAMCVMAGTVLRQECRLAQMLLDARPAAVTLCAWEQVIMHGIGNGVPMPLVQALGRSAMDHLHAEVC